MEKKCTYYYTTYISQSKYPVLHQETFGGTGFLFLGRLGSRANTEKKGTYYYTTYIYYIQILYKAKCIILCCLLFGQHAGGCVQIEKNKNKLTPFQLNAHSSMKNSKHMAGFYSASIKRFVILQFSQLQKYDTLINCEHRKTQPIKERKGNKKHCMLKNNILSRS